MTFGVHIAITSRRSPYLTGITCHVLSRHTDGRIVIGCALVHLDGLVGDGFILMGGVDKAVLGAVSLRDYRDNGQNVSVAVHLHAFFGLQTDSVVDRLVAHDLTRTDVHETDRFAGRDDSCHILIDREELHALKSLLCFCLSCRQQSCDCYGKDVFPSSHIMLI